MYLSKLALNPQNRQVQRELSSPHQLHRTIMNGFAQELPANERVLYRLDVVPRSNLSIVLVQSQTMPDWEHLSGSISKQEFRPYLLEKPLTKPVSLALEAGQLLRFRLRGNTTKRSNEGPSKGKRIGLYTLSGQEEWLQRKAQQSGFSLVQFTATQQQRNDDQQRELKFFSVLFEGVLQVSDAALFLQSIDQGIGSGKAFGFGLLSVATF